MTGDKGVSCRQVAGAVRPGHCLTSGGPGVDMFDGMFIMITSIFPEIPVSLNNPKEIFPDNQASGECRSQKRTSPGTGISPGRTTGSGQENMTSLARLSFSSPRQYSIPPISVVTSRWSNFPFV